VGNSYLMGTAAPRRPPPHPEAAHRRRNDAPGVARALAAGVEALQGGAGAAQQVLAGGGGEDGAHGPAVCAPLVVILCTVSPKSL
jgi:hypothetical protein